jgi:hypothetical protein
MLPSFILDGILKSISANYATKLVDNVTALLNRVTALDLQRRTKPFKTSISVEPKISSIKFNELSSMEIRSNDSVQLQFLILHHYRNIWYTLVIIFLLFIYIYHCLKSVSIDLTESTQPLRIVTKIRLSMQNHIYI